jgi:hypothetical protein
MRIALLIHLCRVNGLMPAQEIPRGGEQRAVGAVSDDDSKPRLERIIVAGE